MTPEQQAALGTAKALNEQAVRYAIGSAFGSIKN